MQGRFGKALFSVLEAGWWKGVAASPRDRARAHDSGSPKPRTAGDKQRGGRSDEQKQPASLNGRCHVDSPVEVHERLIDGPGYRK